MASLTLSQDTRNHSPYRQVPTSHKLMVISKSAFRSLLPFLALLALSSSVFEQISSRFATGNVATRSLRIPDALEKTLSELSALSDLDSSKGQGGQGGERNGTPLFWHILKSGGTSIKEMYAHCYGLVEASESGALEGHDKDETLKIVGLESNGNAKFVNVDTTIPVGIDRAKYLGLVESGMADVIFSPLLHEASTLFSPNHQGRMFTMFRHPVHRVVSLFHYLKTADWEPTYNPDLAKMTITEYAYSNLVESNWMVRALVNNWEGPLLSTDLEVAKEILKRKCLVGLLSDMEESVNRYDRHFGFDSIVSSNPDVRECRKKYLIGGLNQHKHPALNKDSVAYKELARKNWADIILFEYAMQLFEEQAKLSIGERVVEVEKQQ